MPTRGTVSSAAVSKRQKHKQPSRGSGGQAQINWHLLSVVRSVLLQPTPDPLSQDNPSDQAGWGQQAPEAGLISKRTGIRHPERSLFVLLFPELVGTTQQCRHSRGNGSWYQSKSSYFLQTNLQGISAALFLSRRERLNFKIQCDHKERNQLPGAFHACVSTTPISPSPMFPMSANHRKRASYGAVLHCRCFLTETWLYRTLCKLKVYNRLTCHKYILQYDCHCSVC